MNTRSTANATRSPTLTRRIRPKRSGNIAILSVFLLVVMLSVIALAVDVGYLQCASTESQRSADAAAIAATWKLLDQMGPNANVTSSTLATVQSTATQYAAANHVANAAPGLGGGDVDVGQLGPPYNGSVPLSFSSPNQFNAVTVRVRRTAQDNGEVNLFFAKVFGRGSAAVESQATAAFLNNVAGFRAPASGENIMVLPFAMNVETWDDMLLQPQSYPDNYGVDSNNNVVSGGDGSPEINLYPEGVGPPGNRGTLDIGSPNNSTADICRQIRYGANATDLGYIGDSIKLTGVPPTKLLNGDTGISAGVKDDLTLIKGQPRILPLFSAVSGPGNNATYTICRWVGVRIMYVKLTGSPSQKKVLVQEAPIVVPGVIPGDGSPTSQYIYSPVWLVK